jgi:hypothetical protein
MSNDIKSKVDDTAEEVTPEEIANSNEPALVIPEPIVTDEYVDSTIARLRRRWRIREMSIYDCKKNALSPEQEYAIIEIDKQQEKMNRQGSRSGKLH